MDNIGPRIYELRKAMNHSMEKFGNIISITKSSVNSLEKGINNPSEQTLKLICREFNVNYFWLRDGEGEMFMDIPDTVIKELAVTYDMSDWEKMMIEKYLKLSKDERETAEAIMRKMFEEKIKKSDCIRLKVYNRFFFMLYFIKHLCTK